MHYVGNKHAKERWEVTETRKATPKATGGVTGKGFVKGDKRINRTRPGPGRPPMAWTEALAKYEPAAIDALAEGVSRKKNGRLCYPTLAVRAAETILFSLHGKPVQPTQALPSVDLSKLSEEETIQLADLLSRVVSRDGASSPREPQTRREGAGGSMSDQSNRSDKSGSRRETVP